MSKYYVVDSDTLYAHPEILSEFGNDAIFLSEGSEIGKLTRVPFGKFSQLYGNLWDTAIIRGRLKPTLPQPRPLEFDNWISQVQSRRQYGPLGELFKSIPIAHTSARDERQANLIVSALAYAKQHPKDDITVIIDPDWRPIAEQNGLKAEVYHPLLRFWSREKWTRAKETTAPTVASESQGISDELYQAAKQIRRYNANYLIGSFTLGSIVTAALFTFWICRQYFVDTFPVWSRVGILTALGVFLYWFKCNFLLAYGIFEVAIGTYSAASASTQPTTHDTAFFVKILLGLYIFVRGMSNTGDGLKGSLIYPGWIWFFPKRE